jgi:hypothetical protein
VTGLTGGFSAWEHHYSVAGSSKWHGHLFGGDTLSRQGHKKGPSRPPYGPSIQRGIFSAPSPYSSDFARLNPILEDVGVTSHGAIASGTGGTYELGRTGGEEAILRRAQERAVRVPLKSDTEKSRLGADLTTRL